MQKKPKNLRRNFARCHFSVGSVPFLPDKKGRNTRERERFSEKD
nr:MAG TPA: hypothetical protein [Caudoviricetes sp.]